jgi:hypothetical protein
MVRALRRARKTGSLTAEERQAATDARVLSVVEQKRYLARLAAVMGRTNMGKAKPSRRIPRSRGPG